MFQRCRAHERIRNVEMSRITRHREETAKYGDGLALGPFSGVSVVVRDRISPERLQAIDRRPGVSAFGDSFGPNGYHSAFIR